MQLLIAIADPNQINQVPLYELWVDELAPKDVAERHNRSHPGVITMEGAALSGIRRVLYAVAEAPHDGLRPHVQKRLVSLRGLVLARMEELRRRFGF